MFNKHKDLLGIQQLSKEEILTILETAKEMKEIITKDRKKCEALRGKSVVTLFCENSTRTKVSFNSAVKYMSGMVSDISPSTSSTQKGESLLDTVKNIAYMKTDAVIVRHSLAGSPEFLGKNSDTCIINAGDGMNEHPTQALLDMFTILEKKGRFEGLKVAIVGDIKHSRVARSDIYALNKLGATVTLGAPATLLPPDIDKLGAKVFQSAHEAIIDADVVMGLRIQNERQKSGLYPSASEYARFFGIDENRMQLAAPDAILMHPGPVNWGVEIPGNMAEHEKTVILDQVTNGVAVRMAVLKCFIGD